MKNILFIAAGLIFSLQVSAQTGLKKGSAAPEFSAKDNSGKTLDLNSLLKSHKAVILFFYRGQWCPYCNKQIKQLQDSLQLLTAKGAYVIGVTPETGENINKTIDKTHASFSIIGDKGYKIMKAYQVNYTVDDALFSKLKGYGVDLERNNGNTDHVLPVPATYVINRSGKIIFVHFDKDYTKRASVNSILNALN
ncbi:MAG TPA: peroxiredoxin-like family protein [Mucilaginibacter sp.]|jgi:peroxiredoxin|nr:peroxiredoxin-like family protein [Mucilaginibacter sp.]